MTGPVPYPDCTCMISEPCPTHGPEAVRAERDAYRAALADLVRLKDHPRHDELAWEKDAAWRAARGLLGNGETA